MKPKIKSDPPQARALLSVERLARLPCAQAVRPAEKLTLTIIIGGLV